ncbi:Uncharacterised protein [Mycobacteroides abscessus subsp. abscessus]|nr:Uncharacterised protein [Mycobacteroides abscessus subsp. abscessus]SLD85440.1 Uncharacterised protein [Mycobacteroides abscessus subsp. massiliense]
MHEHIPIPQCGEDALGGFTLPEGRMGRRHECRILQGGPIHAVDLPQARQIQQAGNLHDVTGIHVQLAE